jgi:hypothetical protein
MLRLETIKRSYFMAINSGNSTRVGVGEFVHNAIRLNGEAFENAMRLNNNDKDINNINIAVWEKGEIEAYEQR